MSDPIKDALAAVDEPGGEVGPDLPGEEPDARPEGPIPGDADGFSDDDDDSGFSVLSWAKSIPEGSHTDFDKSHWWDPESGGETRLAFHLSDAAGDGVGYPNGLGVLVAFAELYVSRLGSDGGDDPDEGEADAPDAETVTRETAEALV